MSLLSILQSHTLFCKERVSFNNKDITYFEEIYHCYYFSKYSGPNKSVNLNPRYE